MADSSRTRGSFGDCCEGEGGERGKRGKRGPRGHQGPRGPGFDEDAPFWPPFPANAPVTTTIYARPAPLGSDTDGDGSFDRPFATFARAILNVPHFINAGTRFIIDITDLGTEVLPQEWASPPIVADGERFFIADQSFLFGGPLTIRAYPKLSPAAAPKQQITSADGAPVSAVGPDLVQLNVPGAGWTPGALKGKQVIFTGSHTGPGTACCIFDNTSTDLFLCNTPNAFNGGVGPLVLDPGETLNIVEPSAKLEAPPSARGDSMVFSVEGISFQGIALACTVPDQGNGSAAIADGGAVYSFELCNLNEIDCLGGGELQIIMFATTTSGYVNNYGGNLTPARSYWDHVGASFLLAAGVPEMGQLAGVLQQAWRRCVFDGCQPLSAPIGFVGAIPTLAIELANCWFKASEGDAINLTSPTRLLATNVQIDDSQAVSGFAGNAITMTGPSQSVLSNVTGSGNAGLGLRTDDGAHVQVDAGVTVNNADGRAYQNGNNPVVPVWPGVPFNDVDLTTLSRVWEP
jgi:hypothetical protein